MRLPDIDLHFGKFQMVLRESNFLPQLLALGSAAGKDGKAHRSNMTLTVPQIRHIVDLAYALQAADFLWNQDHPNSGGQLSPNGISVEPLPEANALLQAIEDLPGGQQTELLALMWLGRGDYPTFAKAMDCAHEWQGSVAVYLADKSPLSEYLSTGVVSQMQSLVR